MNWQLNLVTVQYFISVCDEKSFSRAAKKHSVAVSAVSKRISELEVAIGMPLLFRTAKGIFRTEVGDSVYTRGKQIIDTANLLYIETNGYLSGDRGRLKILAALSAGLPTFTNDLADFIKNHPNICIDLEEQMSPDLVEGMRGGKADIGLGFESKINGELNQLPYSNTQMSLVASTSHIFSRKKDIEFLEAIEEPFVALREKSATTEFLKTLAAREGKKINYRAFTSNLETAFRIISDGDCVGIFGGQAGLFLQRWHSVSFIPLKDEWATRKVVIYSQREELLSNPAKIFIEFIKKRRLERSVS